jgi:hypothetical protein
VPVPAQKSVRFRLHPVPWSRQRQTALGCKKARRHCSAKAAKSAIGTGDDGFSAIEKNAETAAAMCVGQGKADWGPLTLYALMRNAAAFALLVGRVGTGARERDNLGGFGNVFRDGVLAAAAMCVGQGKADWGPLTLYALMRNGDVVSLCPFLPKKAKADSPRM